MSTLALIEPSVLGRAPLKHDSVFSTLLLFSGYWGFSNGAGEVAQRVKSSLCEQEFRVPYKDRHSREHL